MVPRARTLRPAEVGVRPVDVWPGMRREDEQDGETRQEALRILYRLRADCGKNENTQPHVLQAIESLIEDYERET